MPDPLLSDLCTICHVRPHKYRCPRCFTLTCSLPCIKRHKQWAQCNGVRDPTKYLPRADLATPKGIDHDYNYLTSIERDLDRAEKDVTSRGLVLEEEKRWSRQPVKGEKQFNAAIVRCGVVVVKAPKGMTRSKQNQTICSKKNRTLHWTVEWVHPDGNKTMDKLWETQCISTAYDDHLRYRDPSRPKKKRKPSHKHEDFAPSAISASSSMTVHGATTGQDSNGSTTTPSVGKRKREDDEADLNNSIEIEDPDMTTATGPGDPGEVQISASMPASSDTSPVTKPTPRDDFSFYLHFPSLSSRQPVLIPLPSDAKLATSLTNRRVLEFPTIYVFPSQSDGKLPDRFISEEDFFASAETELVKIVDEEIPAGGFPERLEESKPGDLEDGEVEEGRLLEALVKDSKGIAGLQ